MKASLNYILSEINVYHIQSNLQLQHLFVYTDSTWLMLAYINYVFIAVFFSETSFMNHDNVDNEKSITCLIEMHSSDICIVSV